MDCSVSTSASAHSNSRQIIFIGNSLLHDNDWSIKEFSIINCAQQGLTLEKFLSSYTGNNDFDPELVVVAFGTVEAIRQQSVANYARSSFLQDLANLNRWLNSNWPKSRIVVTAVPPINNQIFKKVIVETRLVEQINFDIATQFQKSADEWVDLRDFLDTNEHGLTKDMTYDGVHLTNLAYKLWNAKLEQIVESYQ